MQKFDVSEFNLGYKGGFERGYNAGFDEGQEKGYDTGYEEGYCVGKAIGRKDADIEETDDEDDGLETIFVDDDWDEIHPIETLPEALTAKEVSKDKIEVDLKLIDDIEKVKSKVFQVIELLDPNDFIDFGKIKFKLYSIIHCLTEIQQGNVNDGLFNYLGYNKKN